MKLLVSEEVRDAQAEGRPVVALESSVISQGLPPQLGPGAWARCEAAVRAVGAVPATMAVLDGVVRVGVTREEVERLATAPDVLKLGARELGWCLARKGSGGTTVSATCLLAARAGIRVFATGGIGGVHRGWATLPDISQDLLALSRSPVLVICAGAKNVLDLPATLEALETLAVPVWGFGTDRLPAFYAADSGLPLEQRVDTAEEAAAAFRSHVEDLGQGGALLAVPPPSRPDVQAPAWDELLERALIEAARLGIRAKGVTPFLLSELGRLSGGRSLQINVDLLERNAAVAGEVAVALGSPVAG